MASVYLERSGTGAMCSSPRGWRIGTPLESSICIRGGVCLWFQLSEENNGDNGKNDDAQKSVNKQGGYGQGEIVKDLFSDMVRGKLCDES